MTPKTAEQKALTDEKRRPTDDDLRQVLDRHRVWIESGGKDGARANLSGADLSGIDFGGAVLTSAKLIGANLSKAKLIAAELSGAYLSNADLRHAELNLANLTNARLTDANLSQAELHHANLSGAYLERVNLSGANVRHANLLQADLNQATLAGADLHRSDLSQANLSRTDLTRIDLSKSVLRGADLTQADLTRADLTVADLTGAKLTRARLARANLTGADLTGASLTRADLFRARLKGAKLGNADLRSARITRFDQTFVRGAQFSALSGRWWAFLCEFVFGPLSGWLARRSWYRVARQVAFARDHNDPWSVLRQSYAGPRVQFLFFMVIVFALPYAIKATVLAAAGPVEKEGAAVMEEVRANMKAHLDAHPHSPEAPYYQSGVEEIDKVLARTEKRPVWKVLLQWDSGKAWPATLAGMLIVYNIGLYVLIGRVSSLRDEEERSGWTPAWRDYGYLVWVHRVVVVLFYVSFGSFLINMAHLLGEEVLIPRFR
jgi:uncharacterized protein YjbI with pentapeptide repeats